MNNILILIFLTSIFSSIKATASTHISCSHLELCRLAQIIMLENSQTQYKFETLVKVIGDPHEYGPSTEEIKNLIRADFLIAGPHDLNPWINKISVQRSKMPLLQTIILPLDKKLLALYPHSSHEALAHFWLYPEIFCALKSQLENELEKRKIIKLSLLAPKNCSAFSRKIITELLATLKNLKIPIILTHDALMPLLQSLGKNASSIVAIKGSGFHDEAGPQSIKKLYDALKSPQVIWIEEVGIKVPINVLSKKRPSDIVLTINTGKSNSLDYFQILEELNQKLKAAAQ